MKRQIHLDCISGMLIVHMIMVHISATCDVDYTWEKIILFFYMPWFFFKSGMFFHHKDTKLCFKSNYHRLLVPFIVFSIIGLIPFWLDLYLREIFDISWYLSAPKILITNGNFPGNIALWYLLSLFIIKIGYNYFATIKGMWIKLLFLSISLSTPIIFYRLTFENIFIPHTFCGLFFFLCGVYLRDIQFKNEVFLFSIIALIIMEYISPSAVSIYNNLLENGIYEMWYPASLAGIIAINNIAKHLPIKNWIVQLLSKIGKDSLNYLVTHLIVIHFCKIVIKYFLDNHNPTQQLFMTMGVCLIVLPLINKLLNSNRLRFLVGK